MTPTRLRQTATTLTLAPTVIACAAAITSTWTNDHRWATTAWIIAILIIPAGITALVMIGLAEDRSQS